LKERKPRAGGGLGGGSATERGKGADARGDALVTGVGWGGEAQTGKGS